MQRVERVLERVTDLPFSPIAAKIMELAQDDRIGAREIAKIIAQDQAFTARLLKIANSPYYGQTRAVTTVAQAVPVLGIDTISSLALALFSFSSLVDDEGAILSLRELWEHSMGCGFWSRQIAKRVGHPGAEETFIAGLLHDMGKALFYRYFKSDFLDAVALAETENVALGEAERQILGIDHATAGALVARKWHLPAVLMHTIEFHHFPFSLPEQVSDSHRKTVAIVHVADVLSDGFQIGRGVESDPGALNEEIWSFLGLDIEACQALLGPVLGEVNEFRNLFDISAGARKAMGRIRPQESNRRPTETVVRKSAASAVEETTASIGGNPLAADFGRIIEAGKQLALLAGMDELYPNIATQAMALTNANAAHVLIPSPGGFVVVGAAGVASLKDQTIPLNGSLTGWVAKMNEMMAIPDIVLTAQTSWEKAFFVKAGFRAHLFFPVEWAGRRLAVLCVHTRRLRQWTAQEISLLNTFVGLAAVALENARLYQETEDRAKTLAEVNHKLEQALRIKTSFLARITHELRSPLFVITGYAGLIAEQMFGPVAPGMVEALQKIDKQAHGLITLITAILDIAQMDSGTFELHHGRFDFTKLLDEACDGMAQLLGDKQILFEGEYDRNPSLIVSDRERVKQVLGHLLDNAAKFTRQGKILLRATVVPGGIEMVVEDTGIGIDPENQKIIFDGFRQVEEEDNRRYEGLGVGLYLSRRILELLGGTIAVESTADEGSRFRVWIPCEPLVEPI